MPWVHYSWVSRRRIRQNSVAYFANRWEDKISSIGFAVAVDYQVCGSGTLKSIQPHAYILLFLIGTESSLGSLRANLDRVNLRVT